MSGSSSSGGGGAAAAPAASSGPAAAASAASSGCGGGAGEGAEEAAKDLADIAAFFRSGECTRAAARALRHRPPPWRRGPRSPARPVLARPPIGLRSAPAQAAALRPNTRGSRCPRRPERRGSARAPPARPSLRPRPWFPG